MKMKWTPFYLFLAMNLCMLAGTKEVPAQETAGPCESPAVVAEQGKKLLDAGKAGDAFRLFRNGLERFPQAAELLVGAGRAALLSGYADMSVEYLFKAIGITPDCYEANLYLGTAMRQQGMETAKDLMTQNEGYMMVEDAMKFLRRATELNTKDPEPCLQLAYALYDLYALEEADEAAAQALERRPDLLEALLVRGDLAYTEHRTAASEGLPANELREMWNHAMQFYKEANRVQPESPNAYLGMAALYESDKKWDEAAKAYREALIRNPELLQGYNQLIAIFSREGREEDGVTLSSCLEEILKGIEARYPGEKSHKATALYYIGFARFLESDFENAVKAYRESANLNTQYQTGAAYYMFRSLYELGDYDQSVEIFMKTMRADPDGLAYFMENDNEFTGKVYPALSYLAYHLVNKNKLEDAREMNVQILKVVENDAALYNNYAFLCRETGVYEDSYDAYRKALDLDPTNPSLLNDAALILHYHLHRDLDEAERLYQQAITEAKKKLDEGKLDQAQLEEVKIALRDATNNLRRLKRGITTDQEEPEKKDGGTP